MQGQKRAFSQYLSQYFSQCAYLIISKALYLRRQSLSQVGLDAAQFTQQFIRHLLDAPLQAAEQCRRKTAALRISQLTVIDLRDVAVDLREQL
jgi:hypothetical protein